MVLLANVCDLLAEVAPLELAESWDNVGLLVGDPALSIDRAMVCLTLTPQVVDEAIDSGAGLVVTHHPLPFRPLSRITTDTIEGRSLWRLIGQGIAIYSAHTAYDSASLGINELTGQGLGLTNLAPLLPNEAEPAMGAGTGRVGTLPPGSTLTTLVEQAKQFFAIPSLRTVGCLTEPITQVAIACGSGGSLLGEALDSGCHAFVTGEASFHDCLHAEARGAALLLVGHYASERFAMQRLAEHLAEKLPSVEVRSSQAESDPIQIR